MRHVPRYIAPDPIEPGAAVQLSDEDAFHLTRVIRRRVGDQLELIDGAGGIWRATLAATGTVVSVLVEERRAAPPTSGVVLVVGVVEGGRLDLVVEKATELGAEEVVVAATSRARRIPDAAGWERRRARLGRVAAAAARQSGRGRLPLIRGVVPFGEVIEEIPHGAGLIIDPRGDSSLAQALVAPVTKDRTHLLVGPEAGFSRTELDAAAARGLRASSLGPAILRTETAAIVSLSLALAAHGALQPQHSREEAASQT